MTLHFFKIALRFLLRNRVATGINIASLALGLAAFLLILEYVSLEQSVNRFHAQLPHMYRLLCQGADGKTWPEVEPGWADKAKERFPEVADYCRFETGIAQGIVHNEARQLSFREEQIGYAEGNFFEFFSFPLYAGTPAAFRAPDVVFIPAGTARKYFGSDDPIGQSLRLFHQFGYKNYVVQGVFADMGENSDIRYDLVFSLETLKNPANLNGNDWARVDNLDNQYINLCFLLQKGADYRAFEEKMTALRREMQPEKDAVVFKVQPFAETHLAASFQDPLHHTGDVRYVWILLGLAFLILLIAWFNYINLSTAQSWSRAGEVGIRKAIGATRGALVGQLLGESLLVNVLGLGVAVVLVLLLQPFFNDLIGKKLSLSVLAASSAWVYGVGIGIAGSLASGLYTACLLSGFNPVETLRGKIAKTTSGVRLRQSLVVSQFAISVALMLFTVLIYTQLKYMQNKYLGMKPAQLLVIEGPQAGRDSTYSARRGAFWDDIARQPFITDYCISGCVPGKAFNFATEGFTGPGSKPGDETKSYAFALVNDRYWQTYDIPIVAGRNFTPEECDIPWNDNDKIMVNEQAMAQLGFASPEEALHSKIRWDERFLQITGVVKNYHHSGLQKAIEPIIFYPQNNSAYFSLRLTKDQLPEKIALLESRYKVAFPGNPFSYFFADDNFDRQYQKERQYGFLFTAASLWAVFIACMGLFGLATFTVQQRTKEIGIRKVLGASVGSVTRLLAADFLKLVLLALLLAAPVAYYFMHHWLSGFAYRIAIQWWMFALTGAAAVCIALLTVGIQSMRAALVNPVKSLRSE